MSKPARRGWQPRLPDGSISTPLGNLERGSDWQLAPGVVARSWVGYGLTVLASIDPTPHGRLLHVSVSRGDRDPTWSEIKAVRAAFFPPTIDVMMLLPQERDYVNLHEHCFHLWQTPSEWGVR